MKIINNYKTLFKVSNETTANFAIYLITNKSNYIKNHRE